MEKPIVLKQRFRFDWGWAVLFVLQLAFVGWAFWSGTSTIWFWLPYLIVMNASVFFARVKLERNQIVEQRSLIDTRRHRFIRILRYLVKPQGSCLDVELTIEQMWPQKSELFGVEFSLKPGKPASIQERTIWFSIELEQAQVLMDYLHAQGAIEDIFAEMEWRKLQILLASGREIRRLKKERGELSGDETKEILRQTEAELLKAEEGL